MRARHPCRSLRDGNGEDRPRRRQSVGCVPTVFAFPVDMRSIVGLIVNPMAARDIRRLVGHASLVPNHEKAALVRRLLLGLAAAGVDTVIYMPDQFSVVASAFGRGRPPVHLDPLPLTPSGSSSDSSRAALMLTESGASTIITLGGDGTNRAVAAGCQQTPLVAVAAGTNNVFPTCMDATAAGLAAGLVASGAVDLAEVVIPSKRVEVLVGTEQDFALVDAALCADEFTGARAVWNPDRICALVLTRAQPWSVGLSSIGGRICPIDAAEPLGLYLELGGTPNVQAVLAPGLVAMVGVRDCRRIALGEAVRLPHGRFTVALDGERQFRASEVTSAMVTGNGPLVVDVHKVLACGVGPG